MRQTLTDLCAILQEQKAVLKNMLELAKEERQIIISGESDKLEQVIRLELKELNKLGAIEKRRTELHTIISTEMGIPVEELTVSKIAEHSEPDEKAAIKAIQEELTPLIKEHTEVNKENRRLIEDHIEYSQTMLELMVGTEDPLNNMYGGDGKAAPDKMKATGIFDGHA